jgi:UDP-N-acetylmuramoyl-tripeptide--D-alanyl-D-alanine ligase
MTETALALSARDIVEATGGTLVAGEPDTRFAVVGIDSRTVVPGQLFVAIRGERHDGHDFAAGAVAQGAAGLVAGRGRSAGLAVAGATVIEVDDTLRALQLMGRAVRRQSGATVVAITGSAGKTTTKEITAAFLALRYRTFRNRGNLNNHIGLPLSLLELGRGSELPQVAVLELGMSGPGEIRTLVGLAEPEIRIWTLVSEAHLAGFSSLAGIADAKAEILEAARPGDLLVANAADPLVMERARNFAGRTRTFAVGQAADVSALDVEERGIRGVAARVRTPAGEARLDTPLIGTGNLANVLAGLTVGLELGVPLEEMIARAATLSPAPHRGEVRPLASGVIVIDDAYNANPRATERALEVIAAERAATGRRIAVLGEMLELGPESGALHARCGRAAAAAGIERLVTVGGAPAHALGAAAVAAGLPASAVQHFATSVEAAPAVAALVRSGDLVLVKGSRGIGLERVVEALAGGGA